MRFLTPRARSFAFILLASGCAGVAGEKATKKEGGEKTVSPALSETPPEGFEVHEWGTFTSVQTSEGVTLEGLHHEEEHLPAFVYGRNGGSVPAADAGAEAAPCPPGSGGKCLETPSGAVISGVTQKLETPVLYFYASRDLRVSARVGFPGGILSEWYPKAKSFAPALYKWDRIADGQMEWEFDLRKKEGGGYPMVAEDSTWAPSRHVAANDVVVEDEHEKFIFYRGLGAFEGPFRSTDAGGAFTFSNESDDEIPAAFLLRVHPGGGSIVPLGRIAGHGELPGISLPEGGKEINLDAYVDQAKAQIRSALVASGLFVDEAQAMVDTWSRSYFKVPGARVLYVVPRRWTDRLLPLSIQPSPTKLVRTLVGRVEILSKKEEESVVALVKASALEGRIDTEVLGQLGRFAEPKVRRACAMVGASAKAYCQGLVASAAAAP